MIKYGTPEYFKLLELKRDISGFGIDKLSLENIDKLRLEVNIKIKASENEYNERIRKVIPNS
jgi:hypothetical protein